VTAVLPRVGQPVADVNAADPDDLRCWSVTTIIGVLDKPALVQWAANETAACALREQGAWRAIAEASGDQEAQRWLASARYRGMKGKLAASALGTVVHAICEQYVLDGARPDRPFVEKVVSAEMGEGAKPAQVAAEAEFVDIMVDQFSAWLDRAQPDYQASELTVFSPRYAYAGTCDGFFTIDGTRLIFDLKTSRESRDARGLLKAPYPEAALQIAAYRYAELAAVWRPRRVMEMRRRYYVLNRAEQSMALPVPEVDYGAVIHLTPESCQLFPVRCDERVFEAFLHTIECARWQFELSNSVVGAPLLFGGA